MTMLASLVGVLLLVGCSGTGLMVDEQFERVWETDLRLDELALVDVDPQGQTILTGGKERYLQVAVRDGRRGNVLWSDVNRPRGLSRFVQVQGVGLDAIRGEKHEYVMMDDDILVFRQHTDGDVFRARTRTDGSERWSQSGHSWSMAKWSGVGQVITNLVYENTIQRGGFQPRGESWTRVRETENRRSEVNLPTAMAVTRGAAVEDLLWPTPDGATLLLLTGDGLIAFDRQSGEERWQLAEFRGGRLADVVPLDGGDIVVVAGFANLLADLINDHHVARVNPTTGEVRWMEGYDAGRGVLDELDVDTRAYLAGDALVVQTRNLQVFDLETGEIRASAKTHIREDGLPHVAIDDDAVYSVIDGVREMQTGIVTGERSRVFRADLATGEETWTTETSNTRVHDLFRLDDLLLVAAAGTLIGGEAGIIALDAQTGAERWRFDQIERVGAMRRISLTERVGAVEVSQIMPHNGHLFVAGPNAVHALDPQTGNEVLRIDHQEANLGRIHRMFLDGDVLAVISDHGVALYDAESGESLFATERQRIVSYFVAGDRLFLQRGNNVTIVDLPARAVLGGFRMDPPEQALMGRLGGGVAVTEDGRSLFLLDKSGKLARFRL